MKDLKQAMLIQKLADDLTHRVISADMDLPQEDQIGPINTAIMMFMAGIQTFYFAAAMHGEITKEQASAITNTVVSCFEAALNNVNINVSRFEHVQEEYKKMVGGMRII
jgi:hypothetical protein